QSTLLRARLRALATYPRKAAPAGWIPFPVVSLNLSGTNLKQPGFCDRIMAALQDYGLLPEMIALELLESTLVDRGSEVVVQNLLRLDELGFRIMLDDFGTGFASLTHLMKLPVHSIKIDKSFVQSAVFDGPGEKIVSAILTLAKELGMQAIAEGIETEQQLNYLVHKGCHYGQGYFFKPPIPMRTFDVYLRGGLFEPHRNMAASESRIAAT
ncbi:EAL domain-containing protein, partial [Microcoleus sp. Pol14D5]